MISTSATPVQVFILCYNRIEFIDGAIRSILKQTHRAFELIISDNSTNEIVFDYITSAYPSLEIRRRKPSVDAYKHLNVVLMEATSDYFMIFHDDDVLLPQAVATLAAVLDSSPETVAASPNALFLLHETLSQRKFNARYHRDGVLESREIVRCYLDHSRGINPFPGYLYRREQVQKIRFDRSEADLYSDMTFIAKLSALGPIWWGAKPLMLYRKHLGNASSFVSLRSAKKAVLFLKKKTSIEVADELALQFKAWNHLLFIRNRYRQGLPIRRGHLKSVIKYFALHPSSLFRRIILKAKSVISDRSPVGNSSRLYEEAIR